MLKRYYLLICTMAILLLCASCENKLILPVKQPDGTFLWNDLQLIREYSDVNFNGISRNFFIVDNVITIQDRMITVSIKNSGNTSLEYGITEYLQVKLDNVWYTLPQPLAQNSEPLILEGLNKDNKREPGKEYTVDISSAGKLPPGAYRLVESFYETRNKEEKYSLCANFWVIKPGGKRPPESETTGKARKEDIVMYVESLYEARRVITDKDIWFGMYVENLSGKDYVIEHEEESNPPILEIKQNGKWKKVEYKHINAGLVSAWSWGHHEIFLNEPLEAGRYRIRLPIQVFKDPKIIELSYEFDVMAYDDAPEPKWEISRLIPSDYDETNQSTGVIMSFTNSVVNKNNINLEILLTTDNNTYTYGEPYETEVFLDGKWYKVPFASGGFVLPAYSVEPNVKNKKAICSCDPVIMCGILPKGRYRIVKEFEIRDDLTESIFSVKEFALAEFTVEEILGSEDFYIDLWEDTEK